MALKKVYHIGIRNRYNDLIGCSDNTRNLEELNYKYIFLTKFVFAEPEQHTWNIKNINCRKNCKKMNQIYIALDQFLK